jgi:type II secretory pathway pseudopilin PulG
MRTSTPDSRHQPSVAAGRDAGFSLLEVVVATALFLVMASSTLAIVGTVIKTTRYETYRTSALNLAAREISIVGDSFNSPMQGPDSIAINQVVNPHQFAGATDGDPLVVDNVPYTVTRTARWSPVGSASVSPCDQGTYNELAYLRVRVEVTWPQQGNGDSSVVMDTILTPLKGTYSDFEGHIGVRVLDAAGQPRGGQVVTIAGPSGTESSTTAEDGCVLFAFLTAGTYTITLNSAGYVDRKGDPRATTTAQVQAGQLWRGVINYDLAATLSVQFTTETGYALPTPNNFDLSLGNSALLPSGSSTKTGSGNTRTLTNLWPYESGYQVWAGSCLDNDPQFTGQARDLPVTADGGVTSATTVTLAPVTAKTKTLSARVLYAVPVPSPAAGSCPTARIPLGTSAATGVLKTSLPYGDWKIWDGATNSATFSLRKDSTTPVTAVTL